MFEKIIWSMGTIEFWGTVWTIASIILIGVAAVKLTREYKEEKENNED